MKILPACYRESFQDADYCRLKSIERSEVPNARRMREYAACSSVYRKTLDELRRTLQRAPAVHANINSAYSRGKGTRGNATTQFSISIGNEPRLNAPRDSPIGTSERFGAKLYLFSLSTASTI